MKDKPIEVEFKCYDCGKHHDAVPLIALNDALEHIKQGAIVYIIAREPDDAEP